MTTAFVVVFTAHKKKFLRHWMCLQMRGSRGYHKMFEHNHAYRIKAGVGGGTRKSCLVDRVGEGGRERSIRPSSVLLRESGKFPSVVESSKWS